MTTTTELFVTDCMTWNVVSVGKEDTMLQAIQLMEKTGLSALPVVDQQGCVCGIISTSDLIALTYQLQMDISVLPHVSKVVRETLASAIAEDNKGISVTEAMSTNVATVAEQDRLVDAARILVDNKCHHLPVVDEACKPLGIISTTDIVRAFSNNSLA